MKYIWRKIWIMTCFCSLYASAQTVHVDSGQIVYHDAINVAHVSQQELFSRAQKVIAKHVTQHQDSIDVDPIDNEISARGSIKLKSPYHIIKTVQYTIQLAVKDGGYQYRIDSVSLQEAERGGKKKLTPSDELLKEMDVRGPEGAAMERQLNEIDMNFQKLIVLVNNAMKKSEKTTATVDPTEGSNSFPN